MAGHVSFSLNINPLVFPSYYHSTIAVLCNIFLYELNIFHSSHKNAVKILFIFIRVFMRVFQYIVYLLPNFSLFFLKSS